MGTDSAEQMLPVCTVTRLTRQLSCCCKDPRSCSRVVATSGYIGGGGGSGYENVHNQINIKEQREILSPILSSHLLGVQEF